MPLETTVILAVAIVVAAFCAILGGARLKQSSTTLIEILVLSGLGIGAVMTPSPINRFFLFGVLGFAGYSLMKSHGPGITKTISLAQIALAILLVLGSSLSDDSFTMYAGLVLAVTLVPLFPFHLPFASLVSFSHGAMAGLWTTVFLSLGLAEITQLPTVLSEGMPGAIAWLALGSAVYASFKSLGQIQVRPLLAYATIAQVSMLWGLTTVFLTFSPWLIPFGLTIALVMAGLLFTYYCIQQRFGTHAIGSLPGLALVMPRLGVLLIILISIAVVLPLVPVLSGLPALPTVDSQNVCLVIMGFIIFFVWMFGSWYFSHLMHQTAFGKARPDIPYTDLTTGEISALALIITTASCYGLLI